MAISETTRPSIASEKREDKRMQPQLQHIRNQFLTCSREVQSGINVRALRV